ncbi:tetratricopeptide repeat protein [Variovorax ginsengisoli]|uniref:Tetratricopeptide repeat protein n=1 Tax=Variovorax ginsengisoli TaxID=363844 RepID=A0ABT8SFL0_9BURK|nr:tetratricopeptide repeat protein [Variovorax ginsengisoli]MDN8618546.1 tetratricopeptide repeat protein [Variovorax ginsengisoli]MDO1537716.1 tetratricopeptide repeat protein [Variovorax ginsengisoli]
MSRAPARAAVVVCVVAAGLLAACSTPPARSTAQIRAQGFNTQGMDRYKAGDLPHALTYFEQALQVAQSIEDDDAIAVARLNLSMVYLGMGRQDEALKQLDGVLDEPRLAFGNDRRAEAALRRAMAVQAGDRAGAAQALDRADTLCGSRCAVRGKILNLKAYLALTAGRAEEGLRFAQQAHGALAKDDALERANALRLQGSACIALKTPAAAVAPLEEALKLDKAAGASEKIYQDLLLLGQASADRPELARDYWSRAHDVALAAGNKAGAERTAKLMASAPR